MIYGQVEKEGLEQELGMFWGQDYWDTVYLGEEARWESGQDIEEEDFDLVKLKEQASKTQPLIP